MNEAVGKLIAYARQTGLVAREDEIWAVNTILESLGLQTYTPVRLPEGEDISLAAVLAELTDDAVQRGVLRSNTAACRDLFDTALMGRLTPRPSLVRETFQTLHGKNPQAATDWFYRFSQDTNYIRRDRMEKDIKWVSHTEYGALDITINLAKPEKDPKDIAAAKSLAAQAGYPACQLCVENEGYAGRMDHPARGNHRLVPVTVAGEPWYLQYSPYVYYNEHCIVLNASHIPMKIDRCCLEKLLDFVAQFPHYFIGSNADLPVVGGSILAHEHFQGGRHTFAMEMAPVEQEVAFCGFPDVAAGIVKWPMSVIRLSGKDRSRLVELAAKILTSWQGYTDEAAFIFAETNGEPHNTITPIARVRQGRFELDLALRNNITTAVHPMGVYHPHAEHHHIKKENIGLIEVMGLAILPPRLKEELAAVAERLVSGGSFADNPLTAAHQQWAEAIAARHTVTAANVEQILRAEVGLVFTQVLEQAGVFKRNEKGRRDFLKFINQVI